MAYDFATNQQITGDTSALIASDTVGTIAGWVVRASTGTNQNFGFYTNASNKWGVFWFSDNKVYCDIVTSFANYTSTATGLHHLCIVYDNAVSPKAKLYFDGVDVALSGPTSATALPSNPGLFRVGRDNVGSVWNSGTVAEIGLWDAALSAAECAALAKGFKPCRIRPRSLVSYLPLVRNVNDPRSGVAFTNSSATVAVHPRMI